MQPVPVPGRNAGHHAIGEEQVVKRSGLASNAGTKASRSTACAVFYHCIYKHYKLLFDLEFFVDFFVVGMCFFCVFPLLLGFDTSVTSLNFSSLRLLHCLFFNTCPVIFADLFKV